METRMTNPKTKPVCSHCGSDEVKCDAWAEWDDENQSFSLSQTFDEWICEPCGGGCNVEWIDVKPAE